MKFVKVYQSNQQDFLLVNLANVDYVDVNKLTGTCELLLSSGATLTVKTPNSKTLLSQISEYNRQIIEHLSTEPIKDIPF